VVVVVDNRAKSLSKVAGARTALDREVRLIGIARSRLEATIVRAAEAGASQREIAAASKVSQPYVSQVVAAHRGRFVPSSRLGYILASRRAEVTGIVDRYRGGRVTVFGSVATGSDGPDSDVDLLVEIPTDMGLMTLARMESEIVELLGVPVDVVPDRLAKPEVRRTAGLVAVPL
jgi:predicted nucleotidyltransferase